MALLFVDTSALVKLYVLEQGTEKMLELAHPDSGNRLAILSLSRVEFRAAVCRRAKLGDIDAQLAVDLIGIFNEHLTTVFQVQPVNEAVIEAACAAIDRHALRAYDSIQFGGFVTLQQSFGSEFETSFVCADDNLVNAARGDGFAVINPNDV